MRVLMTGGGTAGHINPALAIAAKIKEKQPDTTFLFVGSEGRMETELVPAAGYEITTMKVKGFQRKLTPKSLAHNLSAAYCAFAAQGKSRRILQAFKPDVAIGTGGYVCGPVLNMAAKMDVPVVLHEANALPGVTVKMLAPHAAAVLIATEAARKYLPENCHCVVTGNPLRKGFSQGDKAAARRKLGLDDSPFVLSFGGSLGAEKINRAMVEVLRRRAAVGGVRHLHGAGKNGYEETVRWLHEAGVPIDGDALTVKPYIEDMPTYMAAADLVICRCGAMTISELPVAGKPSILIPSPYVAENHQFHNAMSLVEQGAAVCIEEKDLTGERLYEEIDRLVSAPDALRQMGENAKRIAVPDADERIYTEIMKVLNK